MPLKHTHRHLAFGLEDSPTGNIAGVDEAGRGPLAGNVVAAAVILSPDCEIAGLDDSKRLSASRRETLADIIRDRAQAWAVASASVEEIDRLNILQASLLAMERAASALQPSPDFIYVDGNRSPSWRWQSVAVVQGDARIRCVAAASILAKVSRDHELRALDREYPDYGFARHKGYPTREHLDALLQLGPCPAHRQSFAPVAACLGQRRGEASSA